MAGRVAAGRVANPTRDAAATPELRRFVSGFLFLMDYGSLIAQAALLRPFVNWIESGAGGPAAGAARGAPLVLCGVFNLFAHHFGFYMLMRGGWNARLGLTVMLHAKLLRTRCSELSRMTTGYVVSLVTNDCQRFDNLLPFLHCPWASFVLLCVSYVLIARIVGFKAAAAGCGVLVSSVAIQAKLGFVFKRLRARTAQHTDRRVRLISELLNSILSVPSPRGIFL